MKHTGNAVPAEVAFRRYDAISARSARAVVEEVYREAYVEALAAGDPFDSVEAFMGRFDSYASRDGFDMVVALADDEPIGQSWGWPLDETASEGWWAGLLTDLGPDFIRETGHRTFALSEIMVRASHAGRHVAHALHDELLRVRPEERATLLVIRDNDRAYRAYLHWGWRKVSQLRPGWPGAPLYDALVLDLPV